MRWKVAAVTAAVLVCLLGCRAATPTEPGAGIELNAKWFLARGAPEATQGVDGDLYLDTETTTLYVKTEGQWISVAVLRGSDGAGWLFGAGVPAASLGAEGDLYLDAAAAAAYRKQGGEWVYLFGLQGAAGATGAPGAEGADGTDGATWLTGSGDPDTYPPPSARVGDLYLDVLSTIVYRKGTSGWSAVVYFQAALQPQYVFTPNYVPSMNAVAFGDGLLVAVGDGGSILLSEDGTNWLFMNGGSGGRLAPGAGSSVASRGAIDDGYTEIESSLYGIAYGAGKFVAVGASAWDGESQYASLYASEDGFSWSPLWRDTEEYLDGIAYLGGAFYACGSEVGYTALILRSVDGVSWDTASLPERSDYLRGVAYGAGVFVAVGEWGAILWSTDGLTWYDSDLVFPDFVSPALFAATYANGTFVAVGYDDNLWSPLVFLSRDGKEWQSQDLPLFSYAPDPVVLTGVACGTGGFVAVGTSYSYEDNGETLDFVAQGIVLTSPSGVSWSVETWSDQAAGVCWAPLLGGLYAVTRGEAMSGVRPPS